MDGIVAGRKLLEASLPKEDTIGIISGGLVGGLAAMLILVFLFALCNTCKESKKEQSKTGTLPKMMTDSTHRDVVQSIIESDHLAVDFETGIIPLSNGIAPTKSWTSDLAMFTRPSSMDGSVLPNGRQLPSPPGPSTSHPLPDVTMVNQSPNVLPNGNRKSCHLPACNSASEDGVNKDPDPYNHIGQPGTGTGGKGTSCNNNNNNNDVRRREEQEGVEEEGENTYDTAYDRVGTASSSVVVKKSGCITLTQADFDNYGSEQLYASVDGDEEDDDDADNTYASLRLGKKRPAAPPLALALTPTDATFRDISYSIVPGDDDTDDPYSKIPGDLVLARPDVEDPYSSVDGRPTDGCCGAAGPVLLPIAAATGASANIAVPETTSPLSPDDLPGHIVEDDYATVNKLPRSPNNIAVTLDVPPDILMAPPPEPPRAYKEEDFLNRDNPPPDHVDAAPAGAGPILLPEPVAQPPKAEYPYTKVTARESLSSINARQRLLNMYETVPETENTYATVDGGSGDGVVVRRTNRSESIPKRNSQISETYAEIGATGLHAESAPVPPSLDSLRTVTKQNPHGNDFRRSGGDFLQAAAELPHEYDVVSKRRTFPIDFSQAHYDVPSASPSTQTMSSSSQKGLANHNDSHQLPPPSLGGGHKPRSPLGGFSIASLSVATSSGAGAGGAGKSQEAASGSCDLPSSSKRDTPDSSARNSSTISPRTDPDYQSLRDGTGSENDSEYDPNYETVEDAQRKAAALRQSKAQRRHFYEEVDAAQLPKPSSPSPPSSGCASATTTPAAPVAAMTRATAADARERVLRQHTYEDVREVRRQHRAMRWSQEK
ncbi:Hypothetical predicted protein [Octopus vulgaris]|nr:uncharacterized protein LOC115210338 [Octopus sinensis]CAI9721043.1 Hypothetical predicted protein [Octopus vulgaris]